MLLVVPHLALGGADKFNLDLLDQLVGRGWSVTLVTTLPGPHPWQAAFAERCDTIVDLAAFPAHERPARLVQLARSQGVSAVLISHAEFAYTLLPYLRAHLPGVALLDYCHMEDPHGAGGYPATSAEHSQWLDLQVVSSEHLRGWMQQHGAPAEHLRAVSTNIDPSDWNPARYDRDALRAGLGIAPEAPVALYAGRLSRQKQPLLALTVMRDVARANPKAVFLIAGDGQFAPYVRGFVRAHGLGRQVRLLGAQPSQRMRELLAASDVFFLPSEHEGISLAIYEAMAMGVVPVAADVGGQRELVTPEAGMLVLRGSGERAAYTAALHALFANAQHRQQLATAARQRITQHFRLDQMGERMAQLLVEAQTHAAEHPVHVETAVALAAAQAAVAQAQAWESSQQVIDRPLRRYARNAFWWAVEQGAWWLVPALERARWDVASSVL